MCDAMSLHCPALCRAREWAPPEYLANEKDSSVVSKVSLGDDEEEDGDGGGEICWLRFTVENGSDDGDNGGEDHYHINDRGNDSHNVDDNDDDDWGTGWGR